MRTPQGWEEQYRDFADVLSKLEAGDLQRLTFVFECHPHYVGEVQKYHYVEYLWRRFRELRQGAEEATQLREALTVLRLR